jgi:hypothetical protein
LCQSWKDFRRVFMIYMKSSGKMRTTPGDEQVASLLFKMPKIYIDVFDQFEYAPGVPAVEATDARPAVVAVPAESADNLANVLAKFNEHFEPKKLIKSYITKFNLRVQQDSESISEFIIAVSEMADNCEFGAVRDTLLSVKISNGLKDKYLRRKLWDDDLALEEIIQKCHTFEQRSETAGLHSEEKQIHGLRNLLEAEVQVAETSEDEATNHHIEGEAVIHNRDMAPNRQEAVIHNRDMAPNRQDEEE